ncbi:hypothetical protein OBV_33560 [Oscillibacter valericigenes Sjm18-20]|nr:hypothetical protein OBV_33560 [Oscillibacter valericigenes Sjm18-20]
MIPVGSGPLGGGRLLIDAFRNPAAAQPNVLSAFNTRRSIRMSGEIVFVGDSI